MGLKGCIWSSLDAPGTQSPLSHSILELDEFHFPIIRSPSRMSSRQKFELKEYSLRNYLRGLGNDSLTVIRGAIRRWNCTPRTP